MCPGRASERAVQVDLDLVLGHEKVWGLIAGLVQGGIVKGQEMYWFLSWE